MRYAALLLALLALASPAHAARRGSQTVLVSGSTVEVPVTALTRYAMCQGGENRTWDNVLADVQSVVPEGGKVSGLFFSLTNDLGAAGSTAELTVMNGSSPTTVTCTITGGAGTERLCSSTATLAAVFEPGDLCSVRLVTTGTPAGSNASSWNMKFQSRHRNVMVLMGTGLEQSSTASRYGPLAGGIVNFFLTEASIGQVAPDSGMIRAIYGSTDTAPDPAPDDGTSTIRTYQVRVNGSSASGAACNLSETDTACNATGLSNAIAAGDRVGLASLVTGTASTGVTAKWGMAIVVPVANSTWVMRTSTTTSSTSAVGYMLVSAGSGAPAAAATLQRQYFEFPARVSKFRANIDGDPTPGSYVSTLVKDGTGTAVGCTIFTGNTACSDADTETFDQNYSWIEVSPASTPTARRARHSFVVTP